MGAAEEVLKSVAYYRASQISSAVMIERISSILDRSMIALLYGWTWISSAIWVAGLQR